METDDGINCGADTQSAPHDFVLCGRDGERCFWPPCIAHGCMAASEPEGNIVLHGTRPDQKPVILDMCNL